MPIYEYQCQECGRRIEEIQKMSDPPLTTCAHCQGKLEKLLSAPAFQFKGSGWYVTDYADKGSSKKDDASGDAKGKKGSGDTKSTKESGGGDGASSSSASDSSSSDASSSSKSKTSSDKSSSTPVSS